MVKLTIITATLNSQSTIRQCLDSVKHSKGAVEHIVIDGGSSDETLEIVGSYSHISKIISEPDRGIYDAMNKGIAMSTGDAIGILNSDDFYTNCNVLERISSVFENPQVDSCYGDLQYVNEKDTTMIQRDWKSGPFRSYSFLWGWMPPHPTFFVRRNIYEKYGYFNLELGSAADYELMLRFLLKFNVSTVYVPEVIVKMRSGGVSNATLMNRLRANQMDRKAWRVNELKPYPWTTWFKPIRKITQFKVRSTITKKAYL